MKSFRIIFSLLIGFLMLNACDTVKDCPENPLDNGNQVKFQATIGALNTRASGTSWDAGDAIGVYALNNGETMATGIYDGKENIKFTTPDNKGVFTAATTGITFPESGRLDFVAYYPYQTTITNYTYNINVVTQTNSAAIDLLYSNDCTGKSKSDTDISLTFKHMLSMLVLNVSAGDGVANLIGLTVSVSGLKTDGTFNLADGNVSIGTTSASLTPSGTASGTNGTLATILVPGQNLNAAKVTFTLGGNVFEWVPEDIALESGKKYTYTLQLSTSGIALLQPSATIDDWEDADTGTGTVVLTPEVEGDILTVSTESVELDATAGATKEITVTASGAWTATTVGTGFTVNPLSGTGNASVIVTSDAATGVTGKITFKLDGTSITKEVAVSQKTVGGTTEVIFSETFDNVTKLKIKFNADGSSISGFDFTEGLYTGTGADVRSTSTLNNHIWFPAHNASYEDAYVKISNIPSEYTQIKLTYDVAANSVNIPAARLMIKCNDTDIELPKDVLVSVNVFSTFTLDVTLDEDVTSITFYTNEDNTSGLRLDNIKLEGVKK